MLWVGEGRLGLHSGGSCWSFRGKKVLQEPEMSISRDPPWPPTPPNPPGTPCHASPGLCSPRQRNQGTPEKCRVAAALLCFQVAKRNTPGTKEQSPYFFLNVQNYSGLMKIPGETAPTQDFHREVLERQKPPGGGGLTLPAGPGPRGDSAL